MRAMLKLSIRSLMAHKLRFSLTTFAVLLGVSFVVASFVLTDGLTRTFDTIVEDANSEVDVEVRAKDEFAEVDLGDRPIDEGVFDIVQGVDGVREAIPIAASLKVVPLKPDGTTIESLAPVFAFNWQDTELDALELVAGEYPDEPGEFALDETTAANEGFMIGGTYDIVGINGREPFELVGTNRFGEENALAGAVLTSFTLDELQRLDGSEGQILFVDIASDVETEVLIERLTDVLPPDVEAVPGDVVVAEDKEDFSAVVDIFGNVLLAFALVAVFVSTFIISNTFNILLGQRVRELALLRALGASGAQVRTSSLLESLLVGVIASILGLGGGVLMALGLRGVMSALGLTLPSIDIIIAPRTIIVALIVGIGVTMLASLTPARRAATVPPVAAMRAGFRFGSGEGTRRTIIAIVLSVVGLLAIGVRPVRWCRHRIVAGFARARCGTGVRRRVDVRTVVLQPVGVGARRAARTPARATRSLATSPGRTPRATTSAPRRPRPV